MRPKNMPTLQLRNSLNRSLWRRGIFLLPLALACFGLSSALRAVSPPPDGGYTGGNTTGSENTAVGTNAINSNQNGVSNTAVGIGALFNNTADRNTAVGFRALNSNTTGVSNTANGVNALLRNTTGEYNTAIGLSALQDNKGSVNTALGVNALLRNTTGDRNIALGVNAGELLTTGSDNIDIANAGVSGEANTIRIGVSTKQFSTFIAGISSTPVFGNTVVVDGNGQLGTFASAARFKKEIRPMDKTSEAILALRPVTFEYKSDSKGTPQFGLIAEEVAKVNPDLVVRDGNGEIYSVRYEAVNAMLLNEFLKEHRAFIEEHRKVEKLEATVAQQHKDFEAAVTELKGQIQKVSAQLEVSKAAAQTVLNNR
jgi:hypothetical protein